MMKKRAARFMLSSPCPVCDGKRLRRESLSVTFEGFDIAEMNQLPMGRLSAIFAPYVDGQAPKLAALRAKHPEKAIVMERIAKDLCTRLSVLLDLGLGYLSLERSTPTLSPGELQRLRLATQVVSNLFGVIYVLDEPSAGLHPADTEALLRALDGLKAGGNFLFVVEHDLDVVRHADWIVDVGPGAGVHGGEILFSGDIGGLAKIAASQTGKYLFRSERHIRRTPRPAERWLRLRGVTRNNLDNFDCDLPLAVFVTVTGVSGSGKSSLISQALVELVTGALGRKPQTVESDEEDPEAETIATTGRVEGGLDAIRRLVSVDQKPIGRTPRSNLATYTGLFDPVRELFVATPLA
jgi:excinuclease ABC subunit A